MYVDSSVAEQIKELGIQPGEVFQVCKCHDKIGNRRIVFWLVRRDCDLGLQLERDLLASLERARSSRAAPSPAQDSAPSPPTPPDTPEPPPQPFYELDASSTANGTANGHHEADGPAQIPPSHVSPLIKDAAPTLPSTQLAHALKTAISAAADAETFAKTLDYNIRFTADDIRSMGITVLIGMQQRMPR
jgi:hypothetical protein